MARVRNEDVPTGYLTVAQAARALDVSEGAVRQMIRGGKIASKRLGSERGPYVVPIEDVEGIIGGKIDPAVEAPRGRAVDAEIGPEIPEDIMVVLSELGGLASVVQISRKVKGKYAYLDEFDVGDFSLATLKEMYGGGEYQAKFKDHEGAYMQAKNFSIEGEPKGRALHYQAGLKSRGDLGSDEESVTVSLLREVFTEMRERSAPAENPMDMAIKMVAAMQQQTNAAMEQLRMVIQPQQGGAGFALKDAMAVLNTGIELGQAMSGGKGEDTDPTVAMMGEIAGFLKSQRSETGKEKPALPPAQENPPTDSQEPGWVSLLRPHIPFLLNLAQQGKDTELYARVLVDQLPDAALPVLGEQVNRGEEFRREFFQTFPETGNYKWWFEELMTEISNNILVEEEPEEGTDAVVEET